MTYGGNGHFHLRALFNFGVVPGFDSKCKQALVSMRKPLRFIDTGKINAPHAPANSQLLYCASNAFDFV